MLEKKYIAAIAVVAVVAVLCGSYFAFSGDSSDDPAFYVGVNVDGNDKTVVIEGADDYFKEGITNTDLTVYYIPLDDYLDEQKVFDSERYYEDMYNEQAYDEELGEFIPSFAQKITDFQVSFIDKKNVALFFTASGQYAAYVIFIKSTGLNGMEGCPVSLFDLPDPEYVDKTPSISVVNTIYENTENMSISIKVENTSFSQQVSVEDVELSGCFENLVVIDVVRAADDLLEIETSGKMTMSTAYIGYITVSEDATIYGQELSAFTYMVGTYAAIDEGTITLQDGILSYNVLLSASLCELYETIEMAGNSYPISDAVESEAEGFMAILASYSTPLEDIDDCVDLLNQLTILAIGSDEKQPECQFDVLIAGAVATAAVDSYRFVGDDLEVKVSMTVMNGYLEGITADCIVLNCSMDGAKITSVDNGAIIIFVPNFQGQTFNASVTVKNGIMNPWGTDSGATCFDISATIDQEAVDSGTPKTDAMIKELYDAMTFTKVFNGISIASGGIDLVVAVLGSLGIITTQEEVPVYISKLKTTTEEIRNMLADQTRLLGEMNKKLDSIAKALQEAKLRDYSTYYGQLIQLNNDLSMAINIYSGNVTSEIWNWIIGANDGKTMYFYVTEDFTISIMQGSIFDKVDDGNTIDGKGILKEYTLAIPIVKGVTFKDANDGKGYTDKTEANMISCLTKAVKEKYGEQYKVVKKDGSTKVFTASELATQMYKGMVTKIAQETAKGDAGKDILIAYYKYVEKLASLEVDAQGNVAINTMLFDSNPTLASQYILSMNFNFESEARESLKAMNDSLTARLYQFTLTATEIQQLQGSGSTAVQKHFDKAMEFLGLHRGYRVDVTKDTPGYVEKCYVTNSMIKAKSITLEAKTTIAFHDSLRMTVFSPPTVRLGVQSAEQLGVPNHYIGKVELEKIYNNYQRLQSTEKTKVTFAEYMKRVIGSVSDSSYLITSFGAGEYFNEGRNVVLYSTDNPGRDHDKMLVKSGRDYTMNGTIDKVGPFGMYKAYFKDIYNRVAYTGAMYDLNSGTYVKVRSGSNADLIFAAGFYVDHVKAWEYDEAAILTPESSIKSTWSSKSDSHDPITWSYCYTVSANYVIIETY